MPNAATFDVSIIEVDVLSTEDATLTGFSVFPNPAQSSVTISLANSDSIDQAVIYNTCLLYTSPSPRD